MPNIDTSKVKAIASEIIDINNRYRDGFSAVEQAINRLRNDWQQPQKVSTAAFACFEEIKSKYFDSAIKERQELAQYLCDAVGLGYEEAENTNKKLLEGLFEVGGVAASTIISVNNIGPSTVHNENYTSVDVEKYSNVASHAEYARLCSKVNKLFDGEKPTVDALLLDIQTDEYFSNNDPIKHISAEQVTLINSLTGFDAVIIEDEDSAMVIFSGTNLKAKDVGDIAADTDLLLAPFGTQNVQERQAISLVNNLSKKYDNIVVTGHSLGGYLATAATLKNDSVSKCITFDPPGRYDTLLQETFNSDRTSVITSYEAQGSNISSVGYDFENVQRIPVKEDGKFTDIAYNHSIDNLCDALGGKKAMMESWVDITSGFGSNGGGTRF